MNDETIKHRIDAITSTYCMLDELKQGFNEEEFANKKEYDEAMRAHEWLHIKLVKMEAKYSEILRSRKNIYNKWGYENINT